MKYFLLSKDSKIKKVIIIKGTIIPMTLEAIDIEQTNDAISAFLYEILFKKIVEK